MVIYDPRLPDTIMAPHQRRRRYLRGPIFWDWLLVASKLQGASLDVGLVLWHYRSLNKCLTFRTGTGDIARFLGVSRDTVRRAIYALQSAGLIKLNCASGCKCMFTMVESPPGCVATEPENAVAGTPEPHHGHPLH
jgi:hypothetical protein